MSRENNLIKRIEQSRKTLACFSLFGVLLLSACFQQFQRISVRATEEGIVFSHPKMDEAIRQGNLCVFGEISVSRQTAQNNYEEIWSQQNTASGFQPSTEPMIKPYIVYGENLPQSKVFIEPKPLREGTYRINGVVGIYNRKRELLSDLSFKDEFILKTDDAGKLVVSSPAEK